ncbi:hypothetical protein [Streptomyces sp. NPDC007991]|uniref:hypothetical protein n=1 Tax=Streptomyces sp. NPDC007991 TaxID=3364803 RepID=UPI0036E590CE
MAGHHVHTEGNAVPSVDGTELGDILDRLADLGDPDIDLIVTAFRNLAHRRHTITTTQVLAVALTGDPDALDVTAAAALLTARLFNADTNPALRTLPFDQQEEARQHGKTTAHELTDPDLRTPAAEANAALDPRKEVPAVKCLTDEQRKELSKKVDKANKQSQNRPK